MKPRGLILSLVFGAAAATAAAQPDWTVPYRDRDIVVDGFVREWEGVPAVSLRPGAAGVQTTGTFGENDLEASVQALWDDEALYLAVQWTDDVWDVEDVRRRDAVFITPDKRRRDRMLFFDNLSLMIQELEFEYLLWFSPRVEDRGPYFWHRRLEGLRKREAATPPPVITPRQDGNRATLELVFKWRDLDIQPKKRKKTGLPMRLLVADSDWPGAILEYKLERLKSLEWNGRMQLGAKP